MRALQFRNDWGSRRTNQRAVKLLEHYSFFQKHFNSEVIRDSGLAEQFTWHL